MKRHAKSLARVGLVEWFRPGDYERVEQVLAEARALGVQDLRTAVYWADWYTSEGDGWYAWLIPRLTREVNILPCFLYTPPSLGVAPKFSSPPLCPKSYADFIDVMITRFGRHFEWIELWNRPNQVNEWDLRMDPEWRIFSEMIGGAAYWTRHRGKKSVLPGLWPADASWIDLMHERGVLAYIDAVGVQGFPSSSEFSWRGWDVEVNDVRDRLRKLGSTAQVWITQAGYSTWCRDERAQVRAFEETVHAPVERVYWQSTFDSEPRPTNVESPSSDERDYHFGLKRQDGSPKLLFRLWSEGGIGAARDVPRRTAPDRYTLITGGAGFIGTNLANRLLKSGGQVLVYDNLSRPGVERNVSWLRETYGDRVRIEVADVRDCKAIRTAVRGAGQVFHFAAQVAVTTSLSNPREDYEINIGGTVNVLEAVRESDDPPPLLFTSTTTVYGALSDLALEKNTTRYQPLDAMLRCGVSEERSLDFHSPYGCSKGAADQYVLDYARTFGIPAVVFRMSCIYGPHQMGCEDQGWIAHFLIRALECEPIILFGDGMQVRDVLFVEDLVDAFLLAQANSRMLSAQAFNIGGGLGNTISLNELLELIAGLHGERPEVRAEAWRPADQRYYVSDTRKFKAATGWTPKVSVREGVERLFHWLLEARGLEIPHRHAPLEGFHAILTH
jgi:CDP-paratose 2-epimerase